MTVVGSGTGGMEPRRDGEGSLVHVVETLLDKGLVLNADIMVSVAGVELLGIRLRAALASFETAARYGLEFPAGTDTSTVAWQTAIEPKETCPNCGKRAPLNQLLNEFCPWCGWKSAQVLQAEEQSGDDKDDQAAIGNRSQSESDEDSARSSESEPTQSQSEAAGERESAEQ